MTLTQDENWLRDWLRWRGGCHQPRPNGSARATQVLTDALEKEKEKNDRWPLIQELVVVAGGLEPAEAARLLIGTLEKETHGDIRPTLAKGLATVARRLEPAQAEHLSARGIELLLADRGQLNDQSMHTVLQSGVPTLLSLLPRATSYQLTKQFAATICAAYAWSSNPGTWSGSDQLYELLEDSSPSLVRRQMASAVSLVGQATRGPLLALNAVPAANEPFPCRLSTQDLVELLKMPTCFGDARRVVLKHLGNRYGRRIASHWDFVRYAQEHRLDLDFTTPPKRPERPAPHAK
jgi:hypothetical protein